MIVAGIGTALPEYAFTQPEAADLHVTFCRLDPSQERTLRALYRRSGVTERRSVLLHAPDGTPDERQSFYPRATSAGDPGPRTAERMAEYERTAPALALEAAARALADAGQAPSSVTHLVTVSCTGFAAPGVDTRLIEGLGLPRSVQRTNVGFMGCHGAVNGLRVAKSFLDAAPEDVALVCSVELCTLHFAYGWDPAMLVANALFSDGAAAVVGLGSGSGEAAPGAWRVAATGTLLFDGSAQDMSWRIADHGFRMTLSARVPELIRSAVGGWAKMWLRGHGLCMEDVATWAIHPGGPRILGAAANALGLEREATSASRAVLSENGNMSSATILFILERLRSAGAPRPCVAIAFGPGLVAEALLIV